MTSLSKGILNEKNFSSFFAPYPPTLSLLLITLKYLITVHNFWSHSITCSSFKLILIALRLVIHDRFYNIKLSFFASHIYVLFWTVDAVWLLGIIVHRSKIFSQNICVSVAMHLSRIAFLVTVSRSLVFWYLTQKVGKRWFVGGEKFEK